MKFIPIALLLISTPLWAANSTNTNVLTVKAELVTGSCDITASDVDLGDLDASEFAAAHGRIYQQQRRVTSPHSP
jgi:type 1 fimbria pilin